MNNTTLDKLKDKVVFFDFDGVLGTYQALSGKVHVPEEKCIERHILIGYKAYNDTRAPHTMINIVKELDPKNVYVLSVVQTTFEARSKNQFLETFYSSIPKDNIIYVADSSYKSIVIDTLYRSGKFGDNLSKRDIVLIEDSIDIIKQVENLGYVCYHITSLMD